MGTTRENMLAELADFYGLGNDDWWDAGRGDKHTWVILHSAVERIGAGTTKDEFKVVLGKPEIIKAGEVCDKYGTQYVLAGEGWLITVDGFEVPGTRTWAFGEVNDLNHIVSTEEKFGKLKVKGAPYPWSMAEKRLKDRLILKLAGFSALGCYSDAEADFKKDQDDEPQAKAPRKDEAPAPRREPTPPPKPIANGGKKQTPPPPPPKVEPEPEPEPDVEPEPEPEPIVNEPEPEDDGPDEVEQHLAAPAPKPEPPARPGPHPGKETSRAPTPESPVRRTPPPRPEPAPAQASEEAGLRNLREKEAPSPRPEPEAPVPVGEVQEVFMAFAARWRTVEKNDISFKQRSMALAESISGGRTQRVTQLGRNEWTNYCKQMEMATQAVEKGGKR